jgi:hypothetical protein
MAISDVYDFYRKMEDENIILSFKGTFSEELLTSILHIVESKMSNMKILPKKKKRVFNVLVESFQNLYHHIESFGGEEADIKQQKSALIMVKHDGGRFTITTGNFVTQERIPELKSKLDMVNTLDQEDLRTLYREKLERDERTDKGTAGLGLIDIARKSKNKLEYDIIDVSDTIGFFCLNVVID